MSIGKVQVKERRRAKARSLETSEGMRIKGKAGEAERDVVVCATTRAPREAEGEIEGGDESVKEEGDMRGRDEEEERTRVRGEAARQQCSGQSLLGLLE